MLFIFDAAVLLFFNRLRSFGKKKYINPVIVRKIRIAAMRSTKS